MFEKRSSIGQQAIRLRALAEIRLNIHLEVYKGASFNSKELLMHRIQEYAEHLGLRFTTPKNKNTHRFVEVTPFIPKKKIQIPANLILISANLILILQRDIARSLTNG